MTPSPKSTSSISRCGASFAGPSAMREEVRYAADHHVQLLLRYPGEHRQGERLTCYRLGDRERAGRVTEVGERRREVRRLWVVALRPDAALGKKIPECLGIARPDRVQVPDVFRAGHFRGEPQIADSLQEVVVERRRVCPLGVPLLQEGELPKKYERLKRVQARSQADVFRVV